MGSSPRRDFIRRTALTARLFFSTGHNKNSVSSRGWRSAPRDLTSAQALARYNRRVLRFRRDRPLCDLIAAGGPSPSARLGMTHDQCRNPFPTKGTPWPFRGRDWLPLRPPRLDPQLFLAFPFSPARPPSCRRE